MIVIGDKLPASTTYTGDLCFSTIILVKFSKGIWYGFNTTSNFEFKPISIWKYVIKEGKQGYKVYKVMRSK